MTRDRESRSRSAAVVFGAPRLMLLSGKPEGGHGKPASKLFSFS
jgi:hypothetical protein